MAGSDPLPPRNFAADTDVAEAILDVPFQPARYFGDGERRRIVAGRTVG